MESEWGRETKARVNKTGQSQSHPLILGHEVGAPDGAPCSLVANRPSVAPADCKR